jgi:hypothetical protein
MASGVEPLEELFDLGALALQRFDLLLGLFDLLV